MRDKSDESPEDAPVELKPILGVAPTAYLPVLYGLAVVVILFFVFAFPGIISNGTRYTVHSVPGSAAVSVDGVVLGSSDAWVFVPKGERTITVSKPGYQSFSLEQSVRGRVLFSLFAPRRDELSVSLEIDDEKRLITSTIREFASWSVVGEASGQYQFPPVARTLGSDAGASFDASLYERFLESAVAHVASEAQINDLLAGTLMAHSAGGAPGPLALLSALQRVSSVSDSSPGFALQVNASAQGFAREALADSAWIEAAELAFAETVAGTAVSASNSLGARRDFAGLIFIDVPPGGGVAGGSPRAERGGEIPYIVSTEGLLVTQTEVSVDSYFRFLNENPEWNPDNRASLIEAGLVDAEYLANWEDGIPPDAEPLRYVSAFAAEAYASWISSQLSGTGLVARLPSEAEWDYIATLDSPTQGVFATVTRSGPAFVGESFRGSLGLYGIYGNLWEWTGDTFATFDRFHTASSSEADSGLRVVRGGGWATPPSDFTIDDRGAMPPDWCSAAVGFRLVISEP